tara:strand:+ start:23 stop:469 length:447 start_codon:yes stop_codon:yes gene_type:complete
MALYVGGTGSANKLDDFEEGTFDCSFVGGGSLSVTSGNGIYVKIGQTISIQGEVLWSNDGTGTSSVHINLPFTNSSNPRGGIAIGLQSGIDVDSDHQLYLMPEQGNSYMWLLMSKSDDPAGGHAHVRGNDIRNYASKRFSFGGTYMTN